MSVQFDYSTMEIDMVTLPLRSMDLALIVQHVVNGFLFALLQTVGAALLPFASAYKDVFAFGIIIKKE